MLEKKAVLMPKLGLTMEEATVVAWLVESGDLVRVGQVLLEIETEKVTAEVEAPADGVLDEILATENETVAVGQPVAYIRLSEPGTKRAGKKEQPAKQPETDSTGPRSIKEPGPGKKVTPVAARMAAEHGVDVATVPPASGSTIRRADVERVLEGHAAKAKKGEQEDWIPATPAARRLAKARGIDLGEVVGTGPNEVVIERDIRAATRQPQQSSVQPPKERERIPLTGRRRVIARRMSQSARVIPHIWLSADINVQRVMAQRGAVSLTAYIAWMTAQTLTDHPLLNAWMEEEEIVTFSTVNLGIAADTKEGLIVPVVNDANMLSLEEIDAAIGELVARARENRLTVDDVSGATFTISNLGMLGIDRFEALISPPQTAILALGRIANRPWALDERSLTVAPVMTVTVAVDHRALDGAAAARFLDDLQQRFAEA